MLKARVDPLIGGRPLEEPPDSRNLPVDVATGPTLLNHRFLQLSQPARAELRSRKLAKLLVQEAQHGPEMLLLGLVLLKPREDFA